MKYLKRLDQHGKGSAQNSAQLGLQSLKDGGDFLVSLGSHDVALVGCVLLHEVIHLGFNQIGLNGILLCAHDADRHSAVHTSVKRLIRKDGLILICLMLIRLSRLTATLAILPVWLKCCCRAMTELYICFRLFRMPGPQEVCKDWLPVEDLWWI